MYIKKALSFKVFQSIGFFYVTFVTLFCLLPFIVIISGSFSSDKSIIAYGYSLLPRDFTLSAYNAVFNYPEKMLRSYAVTTTVTLAGTLVGLIIISMSGYTLQRKDMKYRNYIAFFIYFTTLFSGGLIPWYIMIANTLRMKNSMTALIIPALINPFLIFLMRNFMKTIPESIIESARIDGAGDFRIYRSLMLPLSTPALATIGLFLALAYWNDWFRSSIFIEDERMYALQFYLMKILAMSDFLRSRAGQNVSVYIEIPRESVKLATAVIATGPVILFYPFVQKYFVRGLTIGAVKG